MLGARSDRAKRGSKAMLILDEEARKEVLQYLGEEIEMALTETEDMKEQHEKWVRQREARPEQKVKNTPWPKASNVTVPLAAINTDGVFSKLKNTFVVKRPFFRVKNEHPKMWEEHSKSIEKLIDFYVNSKYHLNLRGANNTILYCAGSEGTATVKCVWKEESYKYKRLLDDGSEVEGERVVHDGLTLVPIPFEDAVTRPHFQNVQRAPWFAHRLHFYEHELRQLSNQGVYENVDEVLEFYKTRLDDQQVSRDSRRGIEHMRVKVLDVWEAYLYWDVDGDGLMEDIVVTFEKDSGVTLREEYNELGVRTFVDMKFGIRPWSRYGIGAGWKNEFMQDEVDGHHNMRADTAKLSGLRMLAVSRRSGLRPGKETLFPGKLIVVDNPKEDVMPIQMGDVYPSSLEAEMVAKRYSDTWTGVNEPSMGMSDPISKSRQGPMLHAQMLQQQGIIFGAQKEQMEEAYSELGMIIFFQLMAHKEKVYERDLGRFPEEDQVRIREVLDSNPQDIPTRLNFFVETTEADKTEEARQQSMLMLAQLYTMFGKQIAELALMIANPQMPEEAKVVLMRLYVGASKLMEEIFEGFGKGKKDDYVPEYRHYEMRLRQLREAIDMMVSAQGGRGGAGYGAFQGAGPGAEGVGGVAGMGGGAALGEGAGGQRGFEGA